jgi:hypothetical protein
LKAAVRLEARLVAGLAMVLVTELELVSVVVLELECILRNRATGTLRRLAFSVVKQFTMATVSKGRCAIFAFTRTGFKPAAGLGERCHLQHILARNKTHELRESYNRKAASSTAHISAVILCTDDTPVQESSVESGAQHHSALSGAHPSLLGGGGVGARVGAIVGAGVGNGGGTGVGVGDGTGVNCFDEPQVEA